MGKRVYDNCYGQFNRIVALEKSYQMVYSYYEIESTLNVSGMRKLLYE